MIERPFDAIEAADVLTLVENQVREGRSLEFKVSTPGLADRDKREFLADVASLANADGGDILYGVHATGGVATDIPGLRDSDVDAEMLRIENLLRTSVAPRIEGIRMRPIVGFPTGSVLVLRVPQSYAAPHAVTFQGWNKFFLRNSAGKAEMDVNELRRAFLASESMIDRIRQFRGDRIATILSDEPPVPLRSKTAFVLHVVPIRSLSGVAGPIQLPDRTDTTFFPLHTLGTSSRFNLDGFLRFDPPTDERGSKGYCQVFRSGIVEGVWADITRTHGDVAFISDKALITNCIRALSQYFVGLEKLNIAPPFVVCASVVGVKGIVVPPPSLYVDHSAIDRDRLMLPDVRVDSFAEPPAKVLLPIFDALWNASGYDRCFEYDPNGSLSLMP